METVPEMTTAQQNLAASGAGHPSVLTTHLEALRRWVEQGVRTETLVGPTLLGYEHDSDTQSFFMGRKFVLSDDFRVTTVAFQEDLDRICKHVREARRHADVVIVGVQDQSHANGIAEFIGTLAHSVIDAGADLYINHGGRNRGIEVYKGKAIAYGQGRGLSFSTEVTRLPSSMLQRYG